ncbi:MAG: protein-L-isoaspartate(D-aspartate) O-methyltransferase [Spirochaetales bacterium]|nr:protein-L-isoaspartate(D-aspartate) O-methyltransferase [Spirochaetales bacterium]
MKKILFFLTVWFLSVTPLFTEGRKEAAEYEVLRERMVRTQIMARNITDPGVLQAMKTIPRHLFMPEGVRHLAYGDHPVGIGEGQTISQPYVVALMTESLGLEGDERVLEIGTGSGYQASILAFIVEEVYSIEIKETLYKKSTETIGAVGITNVRTMFADGYFGWKEHAPYDAIMITAAVNHIPAPLLDQLKDGGKMILPLGNPYSFQTLVLVTKDGEDYSIEEICGVAFVPMTGKAIE